MTTPRITNDVKQVACALNAGKLAIVPTDTVYGLAASLDVPCAIDAIYVAKGRPESKPIPILVDGIDAAARYCTLIDDRARRLMETFWPGALTIVLPAGRGVPAPCLASGGTVGVRMPDHALLLDLMASCGGALAVTSANKSGEPETHAASTALATLVNSVEIALDGGSLDGGPPSTVVDLSVDQPVILRHGAIDSETVLSIARN